MFLVGVTGGIASGKSSVSRILQTECGCTIIDADVISREIFQSGEKAYKQVIQVFGDGILDDKKEINRGALGDLIFNDTSLRRKLNAITHKEIRKRMLWQVFTAFLKGNRFVVLDVPLLIESKVMLKFLRHTVVVYVDENTQISRLMQRDGFTEQEARARINSQIPLAEKLKFATKVIDNNGTKESTHERVLNLYKVLSSSFSLNIFEILISLFWVFAILYFVYSYFLK
jgi:dephospho-CoA kinase